ncbi:MAG TPA: XdhC family protein [Nocardioides sp.]|jgi:xanthine dehydrogenase accessory factor|nr:XdhC family protein [Nocardioides sp.]
MYDVALTVAACVRSGTRVDVGWLVSRDGPPVDPTEALALTPGGGRNGHVWGGAVDDQLAERAPGIGRGRLVSVDVGEYEAALADQTATGAGQCLLLPAETLPVALWERLVERAPVCLVTVLDADGLAVETRLVEADQVEAEDADVVEAWASGRSTTVLLPDRVITVLRPVPTLVAAGPGPVGDAVVRMAVVLGWRTHRAIDPGSAIPLVVGLTVLDSLVVTGHDDEMAGRILEAGLAGRVGYIGVVAPRARQEARLAWLTDRNIGGLERIHGPAGLDIGARTPGEVAAAVVAEAIAVHRIGAQANP